MNIKQLREKDIKMVNLLRRYIRVLIRLEPYFQIV